MTRPNLFTRTTRAVRARWGTRVSVLETPNPRGHIVTGLVASVMIMVASWAVGWLPQAQGSLFVRATVFNMWRANPVSVTASAILFVLGAVLLVRSWIRLGQDLNLPYSLARHQSADDAASSASRQRVHTRIINHAIMWWTLPLLLTFPVLSRDVYSYLAQGRVLYSGFNPYVDGVSMVPGWFMHGADGLWAESPSPYGPAFLWISEIIWALTGEIPEISVIIFRIIALGGMALCWWAVLKLATRFDSRPDWALWMTVANPLFGLFLIAGVHNDSLMTGLLLAGFCYLGAGYGWRKNLWGLTLVALSIAVKPLGVLCLPFAGLLMVWGHRETIISFATKFKAWLVTLVVSCAVLSVFGAITGLWFGWFPAMFTSGAELFPFAPFGLLGLGIAWFIDLIFNTGIESVSAIVAISGKLVTIVLVVYWALKPRVKNPVWLAGWILAWSVILAPVAHPWYIMWIVPLLVVITVWHQYLSWLVYLLTGILTVVGVVSQLYVPQWIPIFPVHLGTAIIGALCLGWVYFFDPATKRLFIDNHQRLEA